MLSGPRSTLGLLGGQGLFGTVLTLILPGAVGAAPWIAVVLKVGAHALDPEVWEGAAKYKTSLLSVLLIGSALLFGMLFHELGTYVEVHVFDEHPRVGTKEEHLREWHDFLRTVYERIPVGHRYLRFVLQGMFFELSTAGAFLSLGFGILACRSVDLFTSDWFFTGALALACWTVACFALHAAEDSHDVLAKTRHLLLRGTRPADKKPKRSVEQRTPNPPTLLRCFGSLALVLPTMVLCGVHACDRLEQTWPFLAGLIVLVAWRGLRARDMCEERKKGGVRPQA